MEQTPRIAFLPSPGMGHLIPLVEFAKRLILHHQFSVTFLVPTDGSPLKSQKSFLDSLPAGMDYVFLPPVDLDDVPPGTKAEPIISLVVARSLPSLRDAFKTLLSTARLVALVVDLFGTDAFDVAAEFDVSSYIFFPSTAMTLSLFLHMPKLDETVSGQYRDQPDPIQLPGCTPLPGRYLLDPLQDRNNDAYKWVLHHAKRYRMAEGIVLNSFKELEPGAVKALEERESGNPPVYPIGPLVRTEAGGSGSGSESECVRWLEEQPLGSVLFISFGSGGTLSYEQLGELATGLEMSEQRFVWVVRSPNDKVANASYFSIQTQDDPLAFLPKGFLERTKGYGLVLPWWAPQAQILAHPATGGFLTHCGWNSVLESVVNGVPLVAWPLYAEQRMNAVMVVEDLRVGLRPKAGESWEVGRAEIARVVKSLMEGEEGKWVRSRMRDLKESAAKVLSRDGSSTKALAQVAYKWKSKMPGGAAAAATGA